MTKIESISIRALRGIKELELDLEEKSILVYGENGTGKSSIVDALEFFFTGSISHLEGSQELSVKGHGTHAKLKPKDVRVSVKFVDKGVTPSTLTRTFSAAPAVPPHLQNYFDIAQRGTFVLRRSQVVEFIYSKPSDRYRAVGKILGTESLDITESAFMRAADAFAGQLKSKGEARTAALSAISQALSCATTISDKDGVLVELKEAGTERAATAAILREVPRVRSKPPGSGQADFKPSALCDDAGNHRCLARCKGGRGA